MEETGIRWVRETLTQYGLKAQKALGQNFLVDANIANIIVNTLQIEAQDVVIEIGPGLGALTGRLSGKANLLIAVEIDRGLFHVLTERFAGTNVVPVLDDARRVDFDRLAADCTGGEYGQEKKACKLVANLPYYATSPVLWHLFLHRFNISTMVLMVQLEVAKRFLAPPGSKDYGALTVAVQYFSAPELIKKVSRSVFYPAPEVDSAIVKFVLRKQPPVTVASQELFFKVVRAAFAKRRKSLLNTLAGGDFPLSRLDWLNVLKNAGIDPNRRGETLALDEFALLTSVLMEHLKEVTGGFCR